MMTMKGLTQLRRLLLLDEGYSNYPYEDTKGNITIGCGYNLSARGLPDSFLNSQLNEDINFFHNALSENHAWFSSLSELRKIVLIDMAFMGYKKLLTFKKLFAALEAGDYQLAAIEILKSQWATEVKQRAKRLAFMMENNEEHGIVI